MSVAPAEPPPTEPAAGAEPSAAATTQPEGSTETKPPWGDGEFDAEKAWNLIQNLRADKERLSSRETLTPEQKARLDEYDKIVESNKTELEKAQDAAQRAAQRAESLTNRAVEAEVRALAANKFADPSDAAAFLDLAKYANDGEINTEAISADLADLLSRKPHLAKAPDGPKPPAPNPAQGAGAAGAPSIDDQIAEASKAGNHALAISLKRQKAYAARQQ